MMRGLATLRPGICGVLESETMCDRSYQLCMRHRDGTVNLRKSFVANCDYEAAIAGAALHNACSDVVAKTELWCGERWVAQFSGRGRMPSIEQLREVGQQRIIDLAIALKSSRWRIAESKRLGAQIAEGFIMMKAPGRPNDGTRMSIPGNISV